MCVLTLLFHYVFCVNICYVVSIEWEQKSKNKHNTMRASGRQVIKCYVLSKLKEIISKAITLLCHLYNSSAQSN